MLLVALGRVSCWIPKHLRVLVSKICNASRLTYITTGFKSHLTLKSHHLVKLGEIWSHWLLSLPLLSYLFYWSYVKTGTGPLKFTNTKKSPHLWRYLWKPSVKMKMKKMSTWAVFWTFCLLPFGSWVSFRGLAEGSHSLIHITACMEVYRGR